MKRIFSFAILLIVLITAPLAAQSVNTIGFEKLQINGSPYSGIYVIENDEVYISEEGINQLYPEQSITFNPNTQYVIILGEETSIKVSAIGGNVLYPLLGITHELGYGYNWDYKSKIINVNTKDKVIKKSEPPPPEKPRRRPKRGISVKLFKEDYIKDSMEEVIAIRIYADVKNRFLREVPKIKATCLFSHPDGREYYRDEVTETNLAPGETRRVIFYSNNPNFKSLLEYKLSVEEVK